MDTRSFYRWWTDDYQRLDGRLRGIFYLLLLYLGWNSILPGAEARLLVCPDSFFEPAGLMQFLIPAGITAAELAAFLDIIRYPLIFFWVCAAIGLFGRVSSLATGIGIFIYWGAMQSCAGTGHDWYLPMYSLIFLGLFSKYDRWSADWWLSTRFPRYPFRDFSPGRYGSLARKLILLTTVFILFAGGIAKLFLGGIEWLNGESLYHYLLEFNQPSHAIGPPLLEFLLEHSWIITILSIWTVLLELGSVTILFRKNWRLFYVINLWAFHIGIYLLMFPRYFPSMICYLLIVNWRHTWRMIHSRIGPLLRRIPFHGRINRLMSAEKQPTPYPGDRRAALRSLFPTLLLGLFLITILLRLETFPLTHVPMYSTIVTEERIGTYQRSDFQSRESLERIARRYADGEQPWYVKFHYPRNVAIRLRYREEPGSETVVRDVTDEYIGLISNWAKWNQKITEVTLHDMANERLFATSDPPPSETRNILREARSLLAERGEYNHIERIALVYRYDNQNEEVLLQLE